jgi:hypothetical protein
MNSAEVFPGVFISALECRIVKNVVRPMVRPHLSSLGTKKPGETHPGRHQIPKVKAQLPALVH